MRPAAAITSSTNPGGNTRVNTPTETRSDNRRPDSGFFHPARGMTPNYTGVTLTERYWVRALFTDAYQDVLRFAQRRVHPSHAEDVVAEAFLVAWRRLDDAPPRSADLRAWLFGITRNHLLNARRGQDRRDALAVRIAEAAGHTWSQHSSVDLVPHRLDLAAAWRRLSPGDQEVLALTVFEDRLHRRPPGSSESRRPPTG